MFEVLFPRRIFLRSKFVARGVFSIGIALGAFSSTRAASLSWDQTGSGGLGGTGTWDTTTINWWNGASDEAWSDTTGTTDIATFAGTPGTVTLGTNLGALGLVFNTTGYTIATGTNTLTLGSNGIDASGLSSGTTTISGNLALGANQTWNVGSGATLAASAIVSGTGFGITKSGAGTVTLQGANTYTGATTINAGTVSFKGANALNSFRTSTTVASGATLQWDATGIGGAANSDTMGAAVGFSGASTTISGAGTLLVTGNSTDYLGLGNTPGRTVTFSMSSGSLINIQGGNLRNGGWSGGVWTNNKAGLNIASGAAFDMWDGNTVFVDALTGSGSVTNQSNSSADRTLTVGVDNGSGSFSGVIGGGTRAGINHIAITKNGTGTQTISGVNTYTGATTINGGTLQIGGAGQLGSGSYAGNISNAGTLDYDSTAAQTLSGVISGAGALTKTTGTNTLTLTGANTYTGATTINAGTLRVSGTGAINSTSGITINGSGAKFLSTSSTASTRAVTLTQGTVDGTGTLGAVTVANLAGNTVQNGNGGTSTLTLASLTFNGAGTLNIADSGTAATPGISVTGALTTTPASGQVTVNVTGSSWSPTTYDLLGYGSFSGALSDFTQGTVTGLTSRQNATLGLDTVNKFITLTIAGDNPRWSGLDNGNWVVGSTGANSNWKLLTSGTPTDYIQGDVVYFNDSAEGTTAVNISAANVSPTAVTFNNSTLSYTLGSTGGFGIAGTTALTKTGTGTVTISNANTYSGGTNINGGTVALSGSGTLGSGTVTLGGGTLDLSGGSSTLPAVAITAAATSGNVIQNGTLTPSSLTATNSTGNAIVAANIAGSTGVTMSGAGTLTLSGTNTYTGGTTVGNGTVVLASGGSLSSSNTLTLGNSSNSGIFQLGDGTGAANTTVTSLTTSGSGTANAVVGGNSSVSTLTVNNSSAVSYSGLLGGAGTNQNNLALAKNGTGTLTLTGASTYTGGSTLNSGTLAFGNNSAFGTGTVTLNAGTLKGDGNGDWALSNAINVAGTSTFDMAGRNTNLNGNISGSGALNISNSGGASTLVFAGTNSSYGGTLTVNTGNAVRFDSANAGSANAAWVFNDVTGDRVRINIGNGTLNFGSLAGNGQIRNDAAGSTTSILSVGALNTSTTFGGTMSDNGTGILALTKVGSGTLTLSGTNTYTGSTTIDGGTLTVNGSLASTGTVGFSSTGATLAGAGTVGDVTLSAGNFVAPGNGTTPIGTLAANSLTLNGGDFTFDLSGVDNTSDQIVVTNALTDGGTAYTFDFSGGLVGQTYTLMFFGSTTFADASKFSSTGVSGTFAMDSGSLTFTATAVPEPKVVALLVIGLGAVMFGARRKRHLA